MTTTAEPTTATTKPAKAAKPGDSEPTLPAMPESAPTATDSEPTGQPTRTKAAWSGEIKHDVEPTRKIERTSKGSTDVITFAVFVPQYDRVINVSMSADDAGKHVDALSAVLDD